MRPEGPVSSTRVAFRRRRLRRRTDWSAVGGVQVKKINGADVMSEELQPLAARAGGVGRGDGLD